MRADSTFRGDIVLDGGGMVLGTTQDGRRATTAGPATVMMLGPMDMDTFFEASVRPPPRGLTCVVTRSSLLRDRIVDMNHDVCVLDLGDTGWDASCGRGRHTQWGPPPGLGWNPLQGLSRDPVVRSATLARFADGMQARMQEIFLQEDSLWSLYARRLLDNMLTLLVERGHRAELTGLPQTGSQASLPMLAHWIQNWLQRDENALNRALLTEETRISRWTPTGDHLVSARKNLQAVRRHPHHMRTHALLMLDAAMEVFRRGTVAPWLNLHVVPPGVLRAREPRVIVVLLPQDPACAWIAGGLINQLTQGVIAAGAPLRLLVEGIDSLPVLSYLETAPEHRIEALMSVRDTTLGKMDALYGDTLAGITARLTGRITTDGRAPYVLWGVHADLGAISPVITRS